MNTMRYGQLLELERQLLDQAENAIKMSYCPYSQFGVGAAVRTIDGTIVTGANYETAAYTGIHAEEVVIPRANVMGYRKLEAIAVIGKSFKEKTNEVVRPCGKCRQLILEASDISGTDMEVIASSPDKREVILTSAHELLPIPFGPRNLGIDVRYREV